VNVKNIINVTMKTEMKGNGLCNRLLKEKTEGLSFVWFV
jgi:hypothetical protein